MKTDFEYLKQAQLAMTYTLKSLSKGRANNFSDIVGSYGGSMVCVLEMRFKRELDEHASKLSLIRKIATTAKQYRCGNCGEHAAVAFMFLFEKGIFPIDYMQGKNVDHAFVVIGRQKETPIEDPDLWNADSAVCDPWDRKYFTPSRFRDRMYKGKNMITQLFYRREGSEIIS